MLEQRSFDDQNQGGVLYLVPTPIGNLEDMTMRAIRILKEASLILAEDTRNTIKLLNHFEITTAMQSYHEYSRATDIDRWIRLLQQGESLAVVSDAGMPLINDPGHPLVSEALAQHIKVVALPGANAALTALIASGLDCQRFMYYGFFPREHKQQQLTLEAIASREETAIFYESPNRIKKALLLLQQSFGPDKRVVIARELTKRYETYLRGTVAALLTELAEREIKGECVLLVEGGTVPTYVSEVKTDSAEIKQAVSMYIEREQVSSKVAIKQVAKQLNLKKQQVYQAYHEID